jgi:hypothetical protein
MIEEDGRFTPRIDFAAHARAAFSRQQASTN